VHDQLGSIGEKTKDEELVNVALARKCGIEDLLKMMKRS